MIKYIGTEPTASWYDEIKLYNFKKNDFSSKTGHFTQVVWKKSQALGVGIAFTKDRRSVYVVAQYTPAGNMLGDFDKFVSAKSC